MDVCWCDIVYTQHKICFDQLCSTVVVLLCTPSCFLLFASINVFQVGHGSNLLFSFSRVRLMKTYGEKTACPWWIAWTKKKYQGAVIFCWLYVCSFVWLFFCATITQKWWSVALSFVTDVYLLSLFVMLFFLHTAMTDLFSWQQATAWTDHFLGEAFVTYLPTFYNRRDQSRSLAPELINNNNSKRVNCRHDLRVPKTKEKLGCEII